MTYDGSVNRTRRRLLMSSLATGAGLLLRSSRVAAAMRPPLGAGKGSLAAWDVPRAAIDQAIGLAIANAAVEGIDDVFARPFEIDMLARDEQLRTTVRGAVLDRIAADPFDASAFYPLETVLMPKRAAFEYRRCAVLEPLDAITYLALTLLAARRIEASRVPLEARVVFSYRLRPEDGHVFDSAFTYRRFLRHVNARMESPARGVLITADVESFYDRIDLAWLTESLAAAGVSPCVHGRLRQLLSYWADGARHGLPVGSNASRILAEAVLTTIDQQLLASGVEFARYVDDYRLFAPNAAAGIGWLDLLRSGLAEHGLTLNSRKTQLLDFAEARARLNEQRALIAMRTAAADQADKAKPARGPKSRNKMGEEMAPLPTPPDRPGTDVEPDSHGGYSSLAPQQFMPPNLSEHVFLRAGSLDRCLADLRAAPTAQRVSTYVNAVLVARRYDCVGHFVELTRLIPECAAYVVSALRVCSSDLPGAVRRDVARELERDLLGSPPPPDCVAIHFVGLLGDPAYRRAPALLRFYDSLGPRSGSYLARTVIDALGRDEPPRVSAPLQAMSPRTVRALAAADRGPVPSSLRAGAERDPFLAALYRQERPI